MQWYEQRFVNHRDWILDHLEYLGLDVEETVIVLLIDFMNEHGIEITLASLAMKTGRTEEEVDRTVSLLCAKKYVSIHAERGIVKWDLSNLFKVDVVHVSTVMDSSLFDVFETEFGRTLSQKEMEMISDWNRTMDKKVILYALRTASSKNKLNFVYIDRILSDWKQRHVTAESIERTINR